MKTSKFLLALFVNCLIGLVVATLFSANPFACMAGVNAIGAVMYQVNLKANVSFVGLGVEVWLPDVMQDFYPKNHFLSAARDMSALVDNDKINFAEAGADPSVMKNNVTYPISTNVATDNPKDITLDYYDTDSTIVRNAVAIELAYDQRSLYTDKHKKALLKRFGRDAAFAYAPAADSANNPVLTLAAGDSIIDAIIDLRAKYDALDEDGGNRNLVMCPEHMAKIAKEDKLLYKAMLVEENASYFGFRIYQYSQNPLYLVSNSNKAAFGTAYAAGTHKRSSFAFLGSEVMKAQGTFKMFSLLNDPANKGDIFNFQMRGLVSSLRGKYAGAILQ